MRLHSASISKEWLQTAAKVMDPELKTYDDYRKSCPLEAHQFCSFFEGIGILLHRKLMNIDLVQEFFGPRRSWDKLKPYVYGFRKTQDYPEYFVWYEYLANEVGRREQRLQQTPQ